MAVERTTPGEMVSPGMIGYNIRILLFCRVLVSIVAGTACGIIGLTGFKGIFFFAASWIVMSAWFYAQMGGKTKDFLPSQWNLATDNLFQGGMSFVMFWTLLYGIVHIY